ncbi:MAG: hypothetical protein QW069_09075 [Candidatus Caldarchaeum sp.]
MLRGEKRKLEGFEKALETLRSEIAVLEQQLAAGNVAAATEIARKKLESEIVEKSLPDMRRRVAELEKDYRKRLSELKQLYQNVAKPFPQLLNELSEILTETEKRIDGLEQQIKAVMDVWRQLISVAYELNEPVEASRHLAELPRPLQIIRVQIKNFYEWLSNTTWGEKK